MSFSRSDPPTLLRQFSLQVTRTARDVVEVVDTIYAQPPDAEGANVPCSVPLNKPVVEAVAVAATDKPLGKLSPPQASSKKSVKTWTDLTPQQIILRDKITFVGGLANIMLTSTLVSHPIWFVRLFITKSILLLGARWVIYKTCGWHYYLLEFCYVGIALGIIHFSFLPLSPTLYKVVFGLMVGVLTPATVATRNSFVLHSLDKITSLFQHLTPAIVAWIMRWFPDKAVSGYSSLSAEQQAQFTRGSYVELTVLPMAVWLAWASAYYLIIFVIAEKRIKERGYATMFSLQTKNTKSPPAKFILGFKNKYVQYAAYLGVHGTSCLVGMQLNWLCFHSFPLHTAYVLTVLLVSMWNGANYYMHIFAARYKQEVETAAAGVKEE
mmetsp:Transcript_35673/g.79341  ORF Transcript_35673/g.79341 Transcript_35673/m.79341 type:complete len:381 (+) Transcript_35673:115-1257(+)